MHNNFIKSVSDKISYIISPPFCESCKDFLTERSIFCKNCFDKIKPVLSMKFQINSKYSMQVFSVSDYSEPVKSLILAKMSSNLLASKRLGQLIWKMTNLPNVQFDYLIPIPLHWLRYVKRGFNQTEVIALEISQLCNKPVATILKRAKYTKYQSLLTAPKRFENVKNVFELKPQAEEDLNVYSGKHLLIVDDLLTSGATLISAAKELTKLNPASINAIVACRVV